MRLSVTILLIILTQATTHSQEFAPIGAKWYVHVLEPFEPEWSGTLTNESIRDTMLKNLSCKIVFKSRATIFNEIYGEYTLCQKGDSIFHYIKSLDSLNLVMDFGATPGEYWESFDQSNNYESFGTELNYKYQVDSIGTIYTSDNSPLKVQHITEYRKLWTEPDSLYRFPRQRQLIEHLGFKSALLPTNDGDGYTDDQLETDIKCYEDPITGLIKLVENENCLTSSTSELEDLEIKIYPNPTSGILEIDGLAHLNAGSVVVYDSQAKIVHKTTKTDKLNLEHLDAGYYYIQIRSNEKVFTERIILLK